MARVPRDFVKAHTKLLDNDPNLTNIRLPTVSQADFAIWRNIAQKHNGFNLGTVGRVSWRSLMEFMWQTLIVDEKLNGRWWKGFMEQQFEGLHSIINETYALTPKTVALIADLTHDMQSSEIFDWACNGLHRIFQLDPALDCIEVMEFELESELGFTVPPATTRRIMAKLKRLEKDYGAENQASGGLHPGRRIQAPPKPQQQSSGHIMAKKVEL